jgi:hypothetical protein
MVDFYNGNPNIKKAGVRQEFTGEQIDEYIKCRDDIIYFVENYVYIITLDHGLQLFKPYEYQKRMLRAFKDHRFVINLLPRQTGKTTIVGAYILHYAIFHPEKSIGILSNKEATSIEILDRIKRMFENLPRWLQPGIKEYNKKNVKLGNESNIMAFATGSDSVRGRSFNFIYLDEFAFVDKADEFYTSTYPVISSGNKSKVIITSTPNGMNLFHKIYSDAKYGRNNFYPIEVKWNEHPDRNDAWRAEQIKNIGEKRFSQEFACSFFGSSGTLISGEKLSSLTWEEPIQENESNKVFEKRKANHVYVVTVDCSEGAGSDFSVCNVTDITKEPYKQVAIWRNNKTSPLILPEIIYRLAKDYNDAYVLIETNSVGSQVATLLYHEYEYENIIITSTKGQDNVISAGYAGRVDFGLRTTKRSKSIGCSNLKSMIENDVYILSDYDSVAELQTFSKKGTSYEAEEGKYDDIVMSMVIFAWLATQDYFEDLANQNIRTSIMKNNMQLIEDELTPAGYYINAVDEAEQLENGFL